METTELWNKTLKAATALPVVKVNRIEFIQKELAPYCTSEQIALAISDSPTKVLTKSQLNKIANGCINCKRLSKYIFYSSFSLLTFATKK